MGTLGWLAVGVVGGVGLAPWAPMPVFLASALAIVAAALAVLTRWARPLAVVAGVGVGLASIAALPVGPVLHGDVAAVGVVGGAPSGRGAPIVLSAWSVPGGGWHPASGRIRAVFPDLAPPAGTEVVVRGRAGPIRGSLPGAPDPVRAAAREAARTEMRVAAWAPVGGQAPPRRDPYVRAVHDGALLALVTGDRSRLPRTTMDIMRRSGTAHVIAISGAHIAVVALTGVWLARRILRLAVLIRPEGLPEAPAWVLGAAMAVVYTSFVGAPASAWRAAAGMVLVAGAHATGREVRPQRLLAVVAAVHVLVDPGALATPSFQLSYGAVLGLVQVTPRLQALVPPDRSWLVDFLAQSAATTLGATVGTLPALAWWFQEVAPLTLVANLVALPLITWAVAPGAAVGWLAPEPFASVGVAVADASFDLTLRLLAALCVRPWVLAVGPVGALGLMLVLVVPRLRWQVPVLVAGLAILARRPPHPGLVLQVAGTASPAALVSRADGHTWLVDGGPSGRSALEWVRRSGVRRLDVVLCTAGRSRCGGLVPVVEAMPVGQLWVTERAPPALLAVARARGVAVIRVPEPSWIRTGPIGFGGGEAGIVVGPSGVRVGTGVFLPERDGTLRIDVRRDRLAVRTWRAGRGWLAAGTWPRGPP